jgi:hypothetical protein
MTQITAQNSIGVVVHMDSRGSSINETDLIQPRGVNESGVLCDCISILSSLSET